MVISIVFLLLIYLSFASNSKKGDVYFVLALLSVLSVFLAYRSSDFHVYNDFYNRIEPLYNVFMGYNKVFFNDSTKFEMGYVILNSFFKMFSSHIEIMYFFIHLFILSNVYLFVKDKSGNTFKILLVYFIFIYISIQVGIVRQALAITLLYSSIKFVEEKKLFKFLLYTIIAFFFHRTAIIFPIIYFLTPRSYSYKFYFIVLGVGILIFWKIIPFDSFKLMEMLVNFLNFGVLGTKLVVYFQDLANNQAPVVIFGFIEDLSFFLAVLYSKYKLEQKGQLVPFINICVNIVFLHVIIVLYLRGLELFTYRIIYYLIIFKFFPIIKYIEILELKSNRYVYSSIIIVYCSVKLAVRIIQGY